MHLYASEAKAVGYRRPNGASRWGEPGSLASSLCSGGGSLARERARVARCLLC